ncbi:MAG TPA: 50S ribosomal protein L10 [Kiritimatiellia bacterium]|nr:50S ribosomal protein L10 [Kiritimatiellia bacterium]HMO98813.1 50S ribosomal protein L10 [Kiritimatiellia bacterium]HMP96239.1 50S ribosomal protein L10 [Kiritimatiellia bacterium]
MRPEKQSIFEEIKAKVNDATFVIVADYQGLTVAKTDQLRHRLAKADARLQVVKNRMLGHIAAEAGLGAMRDHLSGPSAMVYGKGDVALVAKVLKDFIKEHEKPAIKVGALEGVVLTAADVEQLASLPPRETLLGMMVGTIAAPMSQLVGVFQQKVASLLYVLQAAAEKKGNQ